MESYYILREHELLVRELEARAQLLRDEPRKPRRSLFARIKNWLTTPRSAAKEPTVDPWTATFVRPA